MIVWHHHIITVACCVILISISESKFSGTFVPRNVRAYDDDNEDNVGGGDGDKNSFIENGANLHAERVFDNV